MFISTLTSLGANAVPVGVVLAWGKSVETAMALYFLETLLAILLTVAIVLLRAPAEDPGYAEIASTRTTMTTNGRTVSRSQAGNRRSLIEGFLIFSVGFAVIPSLFLVFWIFVVAHVEISPSAIASGLLGMAAFQLVSFLGELFNYRGLTPAGASGLINQGMGRVALIYVSVFAGMLIALAVSARWFIIPFAVLKTAVDVAFVLRKVQAMRSLSLQAEPSA